MHESTTTPAQVVEWIHQGLNTPDEPQRLSEMYRRVYERWHELEERGELTDEHRAVLALCQKRMQELVVQTQSSLDHLLAASDRIKGETRLAAAPSKGSGPSQQSGAASGAYLQTGGPSPNVQGGYLADAQAAGGVKGDYLATAPQAYLTTDQVSAHAKSFAEFGRNRQMHLKAAANVQKKHVLLQRALVAKHGAAADVSRHIVAAHVRRIRTQQIVLAAQAKSLIAAMPSAYLQADAKQPSAEQYQAMQAALKDIENRLQAHTQAIVDIQRALKLHEAMRK